MSVNASWSKKLLLATFLGAMSCGNEPVSDPYARVFVPIPDTQALLPPGAWDGSQVGWESGGLGDWVAATTSGVATWHVVANPENISVAQGLNPALVTLPDSGAHLPARSGTHVVWFGDDITGTFIGADYNPASQYPKNGGTSAAVQSGTLTSPPVALGSGDTLLAFDSWWEIEGVAGQSFDIMRIEISTDDGVSWTNLGQLNPTLNTSAPSDSGYTAGGSSMPPEWRHYAYDISAYAGNTARLRFSFNTGDQVYNAFRGWTLDNIQVVSGDDIPAPEITAVTPDTGTSYDLVTITGQNFVQGAAISIGSTVLSSSYIMQFGVDTILIRVPSDLTNGMIYDVSVANPDGQIAILEDAFTYTSLSSPSVSSISPNTGEVGVAQTVQISGSNFVDGSSVKVGPYDATSVVIASSTSISATFPAMPSGNYNVIVSSPSGQSGTLYTAYLVPVVEDPSSVTLTAPNGGESWSLGSTQSITWTQTGVTTLALDLYKGGSFQAIIATDLDATAGSYSWIIPSSLAAGADYTVKAKNQTGMNADYSDAAFTLLGAPAVSSIEASSGSSQQAEVGTSFAADICVVVYSAPATPAVGYDVSFTAPASGASASLSPTSATTDASGIACTAATANTQAGAYQVTASAGIVSATAASLTNLPGDPAALVLVSGSGQEKTVNQDFTDPLLAAVRDSYGNGISGATVSFEAQAVNGATGTLSAATAISDSDGEASVTVVSGTKIGTYTVTVTSAGITGEVSFSLTNLAGAPASIEADPAAKTQTAVADGSSFTEPLGVTVLDQYENPVAGATVTYAAPSSGASAVLSSSSATTDSQGKAQVTATAGTEVGSYSVTASVIGGLSDTFELSNSPVPPGSLSLVSGDEQRAVVATGFTVTLAVKLENYLGNPVAAALVSFAAPVSGASAVLSASTATTGADGVASVEVTANTVAGDYEVSASADGTLAPVVFTLGNDPGAPAAITAKPESATQSATVATGFALPLAVTVVDAYDNPVPDATVTFSAPSEDASAELSASTATTDALGEAEVSATANAVSGTYEVTAEVIGVAAPASFALTNLAGAPHNLALVSGSAQQAVVGVAYAEELAVRVTDALGNAVSAVAVSFAAPLSGPSAVLSAASVASDAEGVAIVTATAGTVAGELLVTASASEISAPVQFVLTNLQGAAASLQLAAGSTPQATARGASFGAPLGVTVLDQYENPVLGVAVSFVAATGEVTCTLSGASVVSDSDGYAEVHATAGQVPGSLSVSATVSSLAPAVFALEITGAVPGTIEASSGALQAAQVYSAYAEPLAVLVRDSDGAPLPEAEVTFAVMSAGAQSVSLDATSAVTDAAGMASVVATANAAKGEVQVVVSTPEVATPAVFVLTNLAIATEIEVSLDLPIFDALIDGDGVTSVMVEVLPTGTTLSPLGTVTLRPSRPVALVRGQAHVREVGGVVEATLEDGRVVIALHLTSWERQSLQINYAPSVEAAETFAPSSTTVSVAAAERVQNHSPRGACAATAGGSSMLFALLSLLGLGARRRWL